MAETFITLAETTLGSPAVAADTTLTLAAGAAFNVLGQFRLRLDDSLQQTNGVATRYEICRATFNAGNVVNAFRTGADLEGSTAQAWPAGTKVVAVVTAAALANMGPSGTFPSLAVSGLTGSVTATRYVGGTAGGPPTAGAHLLGDFAFDTIQGIIWTCITAGTPGTFRATGPGLIGLDAAISGAPALGTSPFVMQAGIRAGVTSSLGIITITFSTPFPNGLLTLLGTIGNPTGVGVWTCQAQNSSSSNTTAVFAIYNANNNTAANVGAVTINWLAIGW